MTGAITVILSAAEIPRRISRSMNGNGRHHIGMDITMVSKSTSRCKLETKGSTRLDSPAIEGTAITRHGMWRGCVIPPYNGGANCDSQCLRAKAKTAIAHNRHCH